MTPSADLAPSPWPVRFAEFAPTPMRRRGIGRRRSARLRVEHGDARARLQTGGEGGAKPRIGREPGRLRAFTQQRDPTATLPLLDLLTIVFDVHGGRSS